MQGIIRMALEGHSLSMILKSWLAWRIPGQGCRGCLPTDVATTNGGIY